MAVWQFTVAWKHCGYSLLRALGANSGSYGREGHVLPSGVIAIAVRLLSALSADPCPAAYLVFGAQSALNTAIPEWPSSWDNAVNGVDFHLRTRRWSHLSRVMESRSPGSLS
jgi:hypothetical protein